MANTFWKKDFLIMCSYMSQSADCFMHSGFLLHIISNYALQTLCGSPHKICGEEAKLEGKPLNRALRDGDGDIYDIVAGKFFICGLGDENFASLPKELQQKYEEKFRQPEAFLKMGSKIMAIPTEPQKTAPKGKTAPVTER
jgi:hypothetical protein